MSELTSRFTYTYLRVAMRKLHLLTTWFLLSIAGIPACVLAALQFRASTNYLPSLYVLVGFT